MELTLLIQQYGNSMIYALDEGVLRVLCGAAVFLFPTYSAALSEGTHLSCVGTSFSDELESCGACLDFSEGSELVVILFLCGKRQKKNGNLSKKCRISENGDIAFPGNS